MCLDGACGWDVSGAEHPPCNASFAVKPPEYRNLKAAILRRDVTTIAKLIAANPTGILLNVERSSLQIAGCGPDVVIANLPISPADMKSLENLVE